MSFNSHPTERGDIVRELNPIGRVWLRLVARFHEYASELFSGKLNFSWITDSLAVGGSYRVKDIKRLAGMGVTAVIDAREEASDDAEALGKHGIALLRLPTRDRYALSMENLRKGAEWAQMHIADGGRVYVHCEHGVGRGPLMGAAVLIAGGYTAPQALRIIRAKRWQAAPNDRQLEQLLRFYDLMHGGGIADAPDAVRPRPTH
jgi:hypothetical protein